MRTLGTLAGLASPAKISVEESEDVKREVLLELARRRLANHPEQEADESVHPLRRMSLFDLLGEYLPDSGRIIVYTAMCRCVAEKIGVMYDELVAVVRLHEEAHAVTHLGRDENGETWQHFRLASVEDKELAAQVLTFLYCKTSDRASLLGTFHTLEQLTVAWARAAHVSSDETQSACLAGKLAARRNATRTKVGITAITMRFNRL